MLDEQEMSALAALLWELADRVGDERLSDEARLMAGMLRERLDDAGRGGVVPGESAETRQGRAADRDHAAEQRDRAAQRRDEAAERHDRAAVERGHEARRGRLAGDAADRAFHDALWQAEQRAQAIDQRDEADGPDDGRDLATLRQEWQDAREHDRTDRAALRERWDSVRQERAARLADEEAGRRDRRRARDDRQMAGADRAEAAHDREASLADWEQAEIERQQGWPPSPDTDDNGDG
ncbi:hypothetical protein SAMN05444920_104538 [Nonomuraea solani]|uniref:Colicin import membrane protein n=1 Tax=Nonomuraea solani TaxID=1144553 RepID=A0A1H6CYJ3_9ACTN|nr:hypothetical protein [Nonomuraea solani]SEG77877.1 hypothetical protein SAMN05444920_104538 [Nonomuraea solani]